MNHDRDADPNDSRDECDERAGSRRAGVGRTCGFFPRQAGGAGARRAARVLALDARSVSRGAALAVQKEVSRATSGSFPDDRRQRQKQMLLPLRESPEPRPPVSRRRFPSIPPSMPSAMATPLFLYSRPMVVYALHLGNKQAVACSASASRRAFQHGDRQVLAAC